MDMPATTSCPSPWASKLRQGPCDKQRVCARPRVEAERKALEEAEQLAQALMGSRVVVAARAGDEGQLFGSVGVADVAEAIKKFTGIDVDREIVDVGPAIKEIGLHEVSLRPHAEVEFKVSLDVIPA